MDIVPWVSEFPVIIMDILIPRLCGVDAQVSGAQGGHRTRPCRARARTLVGNRQQTTTNSRQTAAAPAASKTQNTKDSDLNVSDKENKTPDRNYRYIIFEF